MIIRASFSSIRRSLILLSMLFAAPCLAQEKFSYTYSSPPDASRYVRDHSIDVDDVTGHKVRVVEIQRTYAKDPPMLMGTKVVESWFRGITDYGANGGPGHGYETWLMEDGSKVFTESTFLSKTETSATGSRRGVSHATIRIVGGTGRFATIRGSLVSETEFDNDPNNGYNRPVTKGEYWLQTQ